MFSAEYTIQMPGSLMQFKITIKGQQLDEDDELVPLNLSDVCAEWWNGDVSKEYKRTPHSLALGLWLHLSGLFKADRNFQLRDVVVQKVTLIGAGMTTSFGLDK